MSRPDKSGSDDPADKLARMHYRAPLMHDGDLDEPNWLDQQQHPTMDPKAADAVGLYSSKLVKTDAQQMMRVKYIVRTDTDNEMLTGHDNLRIPKMIHMVRERREHSRAMNCALCIEDKKAD